MVRPVRRGVLRVLLILYATNWADCALLEMSRVLWNKTVSGATKIGKVDPLRVPLIKVDQTEGDANYRVILTNLEVAGLNGSILESVHVARGAPRANLSELADGYVSYSDLRDVDTIRYRFHTMTREPSAPKETFEAVVSPINRAADTKSSSRYQDARQDRFQDRHATRTFEQSRQYDQPIPFRPYATSDGFYRGNLKTSDNSETKSGSSESFRRPAYVQPIYMQRTRGFQGYQSPQAGEDTIDCDDAKGFQFKGRQDNQDNQDNQRYIYRQNANAGYSGERVADAELSASEIVETRLKNQGDARPPVLYNREQSQRTDIPSSGNVELSRSVLKERSGYIDIVYADKINGSVKHFGNLGTDGKGTRRIYGIEDVIKNIQENTKFIVYNFTEGEPLEKRNDLIKAAIEARRLKDLRRYAKNYQEQQGYFEEGMQLFYHFGGMDSKNGSFSRNFGDIKRTKRAHSEEESEDDVMHAILRIRVPLLRVKSQYTLTGKVGKEILRGNGLFAGNFTDVVADFTLELKKFGEDLIVRSARAKLSAKDKKIDLQGIDEKGPVQIVFNHGLMAAEAVAAMLADDFASKGLSERTADALIYRMYKDLPFN
ncbi:hypothetical protein PUN28_018767 [Cardiocondyla obscurior]|uniref:Uncharacterized protein n=1 Tax=Cardiocondyla obscurior TaxID=286306 RepID=A0AAW2EBT3_9HYME